VRIAEYERKIAELERKLGQLTMEVDLLKKGARLGRTRNVAYYSIVSSPGPSPSRDFRVATGASPPSCESRA